MRLSTSTAILHHHFDYALTLTDIPAVIRTAGFDALDWSTWQFCLQGGKVFAGLLNDDAWEAQINALREADERAGIVCRQTHCVSTNYARYQTLDAEHLRLLEQRCIRTAAILGAEWTVIHPFAPEDAAREESIRYFCEYLKPLEELAGKLGVGIAIENEGQIYLLHASVSDKKVSVTTETLPDYLQRITSHSGIMIGRLINFKSN